MDAPQKRFKVTLVIEAWEWKDVLSEIQWLKEHLGQHGSRCNSTMGGGSKSHTVHVNKDEDITEEEWEERLDAYVKTLKGDHQDHPQKK